MAKKEIFFFATKTDLLPHLLTFEAMHSVNYIPNRAFDRASVTTFGTIQDIDKLGINTSGNHQSESFFVLDKNERIQVRAVRQETGGMKYFVDLNLVNKSIVFWPGGLYDEKNLVCGHVGTTSDNPLSQELFKQFTRDLVKGFVKKGTYYLGPEALEISKHVRLITMNVNQPIEYDMTI